MNQVPHVNRIRSASWVTGLILFEFMATVVCAQDEISKRESSSLDQITPWSCVMANQESVFYFRDQSNDVNNVVTWKLLKSGRVVGSGRAERVVRNARDEVSIKFDSKNVEIQSVLELELVVDFGNEVASKQVFLFPRDPFADNHERLKQQDIHLFDPTSETAEILESINFPFKRVHRLAGLSLLNSGLIIIGEGLNVRKHPLIVEMLCEAVDRGVQVLVLAPDEGKFKLDSKNQTGIVSRNETFIKDFDRRLDSGFWLGQPCVHRRWEINQQDGEVSLRSTGESTGWTWVKFQYDEASISFCGFGIVKRWNDGPVARHLLWQMIDSFSSTKIAGQNAAKKNTKEDNDNR